MTKILDIKADKHFFHHYIVCVGTHSGINNPKTGQFYLKYNVIHFTHDDIEKVRDAIMLGHDQVFKTSMKDAMNIFECSNMVSSLSSLKYACNANNISMHHFSSQDEMEEGWFENIVNNAHKVKYFKELLQRALI